MKTFNDYLTETNEIGFVEEALSSLAYVSGLPNAQAQEMILFESGEAGMVGNIYEKQVEVYVFANKTIKSGTRVARTNTLFSMPVGKEYLGKTIDPFGNLLDKFVSFTKPTEERGIDTTPGDMSTRKRISETLDTGVSLVDMLITLGKGQRELVIGDRKTGKTNFLYQTIVSQARLGTICIYVAIGKKRLDIKDAESHFTKQNILANTIILASTADDPSSIIFLTPYCAMTLAEYFRDAGHDVLIVLDDMFTHAKFYREISLLGRRFPARNSYPADIFYTHARLMERAGNFLKADGSAQSISCIPVVETVQGDLSGYIQTNLMSMTDGHIYFDIDSFAKGRRPAINPFLSVSRVGRQTQSSLKRSINREVMSFLTLRERMEKFSHFGTEATPMIKDVLTTGDHILHFFDQDPELVLNGNIQLFLFTVLWFGFWNGKPNDQMKKNILALIQLYNTDKEFAKSVDTMTTNAKTLNEFMAVIGKDVIPNLKKLFPEPIAANSVRAIETKPTETSASTQTGEVKK